MLTFALIVLAGRSVSVAAVPERTAPIDGKVETSLDRLAKDLQASSSRMWPASGMMRHRLGITATRRTYGENGMGPYLVECGS